MSARIAALVFAGASQLCMHTTRAAECELSGEEVIREAETKGFLFRANKSNGDGSCTRFKFSFLATAGQSSSVTCSVEFFGKHSLKDGWTIRDVWLSGSWQYARKLSPGSDASFEITATADPATTNTVSLTKVRLNGTNCANWKNAF